MLDDVTIRQPVIGHAGHIELMRAATTTRQPDIGLTGLAGTIDDTADDRHRHRNVDMFQPFLDCLHGADHVELLARA